MVTTDEENVIKGIKEHREYHELVVNKSTGEIKLDTQSKFSFANLKFTNDLGFNAQSNNNGTEIKIPTNANS